MEPIDPLHHVRDVRVDPAAPAVPPPRRRRDGEPHDQRRTSARRDRQRDWEDGEEDREEDGDKPTIDVRA